MLHVIPGVAPRYGGPSQAVLEMVRALRARGVEAEIATTDADGPEGRLAVATGRRVEFEGCPCWFFRREWGEALKYARGLSFWLRERVRDYDVVHIHAVFSHTSVEAGRAGRRAGVPYVVRPLGTLEPWSLRQRAWRKRVFWWLGARALVHHAAAVHYTSHAERRGAEQALGIGRGVVIPHGVAPAPAAEASQDPPYALVLGRLHRKKRVEMVLDAFARLHQEGRLRAWQLWIAGAGGPSYETELRARATAFRERVRFLGWVEGAHKARVLAGASLLVSASRHENFGIAVAEAMAAGVPVLVTPEVDLSEEVARVGAGWVVEGDSGSLARTLEEILTRPDELRARGAAGRALVSQRYEWSRVGDELRGLYLRVREGGGESGAT